MTELSPTEIGRIISGMRRQEQKVCPRCGTSFMGIRTKVYCSHACAVAQYQEDHREEVNEWRRRRYQEKKAGQE